ncbi:beta-N-acetylhexosaminidase [Paenibacillus humicola]|uniref:beta-N-acetylhexosaminidase n=1 Tax=Paenibacillus humicola TaxID=3110540 RepID=UPI00237BF253|nr:beta-N-acetylhexosaminidase [Paenibacillus humicola]
MHKGKYGLAVLAMLLIFASGCSGQKSDSGQQAAGGAGQEMSNGGTNQGTADGGASGGQQNAAAGGTDTSGGAGGTSEGAGGGADGSPGAGTSGNTGGSQNGDGAGATSPDTGSGLPAPSANVLRQLQSMTLDEKLGEMIVAGMDGNTPTSRTKTMIQQQHVGGVIFYKNNVTDPKGLAAYVNQLKAWNRDNPSALFLSVDEEGGTVSRLPGLEKFPDAWDVGKTKDTGYAADMGGFLGAASSAMGMNVDYAPVLDINSNPNNPVIGVRSFGATSDLVSQMGLPVMKGIQAQGVISVVKHFPGHGDTSVDSHLDLPVVNKSLKQLQQFEWVPFADAIREGADAVMVAHILFPKIDPKYPASLSKTIITDELRGTLGFQGVVITDDLTMGAIGKHFGIGEAAVQSVKAGADIMLVAHGYDDVVTVIDALKKSISQGGISKKRIDESVTRILTLKEKYGLSDRKTVQTPNLTSLNAEIRKAIGAH